MQRRIHVLAELPGAVVLSKPAEVRVLGHMNFSVSEKGKERQIADRFNHVVPMHLLFKSPPLKAKKNRQCDWESGAAKTLGC